MKAFIEALFGLRKGERGLALWMFAYHYLLLVTLYLLKPVRDSLFLVERGPDELPYVFILTTLVVIPASLLYARTGQTQRMGLLISGTTVVLAGALVGLRLLMGAAGDWASYVLYVFVSIYGVLVTSQFWLFAGAVFNAAQSKRVFTVLGLGAILGAITGGEMTSLLLEQEWLSSEQLLLAAAALLVASLGIVWYVVRRVGQRVDEDAFAAEPARRHADERDAGSARSTTPDAPSTEEQEQQEGVWATLAGSTHLQRIVGVIALAVLTTTLIDFQFKTLAAEAISAEEELSSFMGRFYSRVSIVALVLQLVVAPRVLRSLGAGTSMLLLPAGLGAGAAAVLAVPNLLTGTLLRGIDQAVKHSIDKTGRELLFLPVELEAKKRVKVFIDLFVDQGAQGVGGLLLLLLTAVLGLGVREVSVVVLVLLVGWMGLVVLARYSYVETFRSSLQQQVEEDEEEEEAEPVPATRRVYSALSSSSAAEIAASLESLEDSERRVPVSTVQRLLSHHAPEVRQGALRLLRVREIRSLRRPALALLNDEEREVRLEAGRYLFGQLPAEGRVPLLREGLRHPDPEVRALAVGIVAEEGTPEEHELVPESTIRELAAQRGEERAGIRREVAHFLCCTPSGWAMDLLHELARDEDEEVAASALHAMGRRARRDAVPLLIERVREGSATAEAAREALGAFGERILGTLYDYLSDPELPTQERARLPAVLAGIYTQATVDLLLISMRQTASVPVRDAVAEALSRLREQSNEQPEEERLRFRWEALRPEVRREARHYAALGQALARYDAGDDDALAGFPRDALTTARAETLERLFRLLGLYYLQEDMRNAHRGLTNDREDLRAGALEFIDNLLDIETKGFLVPLLDDPDGAMAVKHGPDLFDLDLQRWPEVLAYLLRTQDPSLVAAAAEQAERYELSALRSHLHAAAAQDPPDEVAVRIEAALETLPPAAEPSPHREPPAAERQEDAELAEAATQALAESKPEGTSG